MDSNASERAAHFAEHHSRHAGLIDEASQKILADTTILIAGCGVGSLVALSAARLGFGRFILVDGDRVEKSNINRQGYTQEDVGSYKARALAEHIRRINPHAVALPHAEFVTFENVAGFVEQADLIVDAIDPEASLMELALHQAARKTNKPVIQPSDMGWGGMVHIFTKDSARYEELLDLPAHTDLAHVDQNELLNKVITYYLSFMPTYVKGITMDFVEGRLGHFPQPVSAAYIVAAMSVTALKRLALGLPVKVAPDYVAFDPDLLFDPTAA